MKTLGRLVLLGIVLLLVGGIVFYLHPIWTQTQITHLNLFAHRVNSNYVMTPEGRVHYYEAEPRFAPGHGVPLVLVHGLADRSESWAPMIERLKKAGFHVYAPDLLGYGRSPKPDGGDYSIAGEEQFVVDFIQAIGLPKTSIGGWSMGGWITLKLALDHPDLIDRVVVYDTAGIRAGQTEPPASYFHPQTPEDVQGLFKAMEPDGKPLPAFVAKDVLRAMESNSTVIDKQMAGMSSGKDALDEAVTKLQQPLLIVWGKDDQLTPLAVGMKLHEFVPASELDVLERCGHLEPSKCSVRAAQATADFLKANPVPVAQVRVLRAMER